jgi:isoleucyl-tRNA synthetase
MTYAEINNWEPSGKELSEMKLTTIDEWILARLAQLTKIVTTSLDNYDPMVATRSSEDFVNDLSTWYIRRSRDRFAAKDAVAMEVLYYVLVELSKLLAPFIPFITETMYQNLVLSVNAKASESVHLTDYPELKEFDETLINQMNEVRRVVALAQAVRVESKMKVKQPLSELQIAGVKLSPELCEIVADELNVKKASIVEKVDESDGWLTKDDPGLKVSLNTNLTDELKKEGLFREIARSVQALRKDSGMQMGELVKLYWQTDSSEVAEVFQTMENELKKAVSAGSVINEEVEEMKESKVNAFVLKLKVEK